jgi:hypothetical protein
MTTYERRTVPTAELKVGDIIPAPRLGLPTIITSVSHDGDGQTSITYLFESWGRRRRVVVRRKTAGRSTILKGEELP